MKKYDSCFLFSYGNELLKKEYREKEGESTRRIQSSAVIGASIMWGDIAWLFIKIDIPVRLRDLEWAAISTALNRAKRTHEKLKKKRKYKFPAVTRKVNLISGTTEDFFGGGRTCSLKHVAM